MNEFREFPVSEVRAGYFVESEFSCRFVESESSSLAKSESIEFVKSLCLSLFGCLFGVLYLCAEQVQGDAP